MPRASSRSDLPSSSSRLSARAASRAVCAAALVLALAACTQSGPGPGPSRTPSASPTMQVLASIEVGASPCALAEFEGKVWVTLLKAGEVVAIDPATNAVVARHAVPVEPCGITATADGLWVGGGKSRLVRIDPASGAIRRTVAVPGPVWDLQSGAGALWVSLGERGSVVRVDPARGLAGPARPVGTSIGGLAVGPDAVYVADTAGHDIAVLDPTSAAVKRRWTLPGDPTWLALDGSTLWASLTAQHRLVAIDTATGAVVTTVEAGTEPLDPGAAGGRAYVPDHSGTTLTWADRDGSHGSVPLAGRGFWVADEAVGDVWALGFEGSSVQRLSVPRPVGPAPAPSPTDTAPSPTETAPSASGDLDLLAKNLEIHHPKPFHGIPRTEWLARLESVRAGLGRRTPEETLVDVMGLVAALSRAGRDGHQIAIPLRDEPMLPVQVFEFTDGVFITNAKDPTLVGARVMAVEGHPIGDVLSTLEPLVPRDSEASVPLFRPFFLLRANVLRGLHLVARTDVVRVTVRQNGADREVALGTIPTPAYAALGGDLGVIQLPSRNGLRFTDHTTLFTVERMGRAVHAHLSKVATVPEEDLARLRNALSAPGVDRVVLDLRQNPGGDNRTYGELVDALRAPKLPLWVLTDRATFSAASNLATELEQTSKARFAGEAMGGGLNFWDQVSFVRLEHLPIPVQVGISTQYYERSSPDDPRLTIEPSVAVPLRSADYFAGRDRVLEAVLAAPAR